MTANIRLFSDYYHLFVQQIYIEIEKNSRKDEHIRKLDLQKYQQNESTSFETDYKRKSEHSTLKIRYKKRDISDTEEMKRFIKISTSNFYGGVTFKTLKKGMLS